jgi:DNA-binding CsgD family transcriptional regulator
VLVSVQSMRGDILAARQVLDLVEGFPRSASAGFRWWLDRAMLAWRAGLGDVESAAQASIELARAHEGEEFHVTTSLHDAVRYGAAERVADAHGAQAARPGATWWDEQCHRHAAAAAGRDADALLEVAADFEQGGLDLDALESYALAADVARDPRIRVPQAAARAVVGITRAGEVCGRVRTPAMVTHPPGITARELTVARMAAVGMSNGEIGAQLGTSVRTVGNQLQRVFDRLGVHSRHALAEVLEPSH